MIQTIPIISVLIGRKRWMKNTEGEKVQQVDRAPLHHNGQRVRGPRGKPLSRGVRAPGEHALQTPVSPIMHHKNIPPGRGISMCIMMHTWWYMNRVKNGEVCQRRPPVFWDT